MRKLFFITILVLLGFSCKKERLKGNKKLLIGKWELAYIISYRHDYRRGETYFSDSIIPGINAKSRFITFKKSGEVLAEMDGNESKYKINFKTKYSNDPSFDNDKSKVNLFTEDGYQYLGDFHKFKANFHHKGDDKEANVINGAVNDDVLTLDMGWAFFELDKENSNSQWVFNRVQ